MTSLKKLGYNLYMYNLKQVHTSEDKCTNTMLFYRLYCGINAKGIFSICHRIYKVNYWLLYKLVSPPITKSINSEEFGPVYVSRYG